jgi:plastocyanin
MRRFLSPFIAFVLSGLLAAPGNASVVSGSVKIQGRIEKVQLKKIKKFNPYGDLYDSKTGPAAELPQQLIVYVDGLRAGNGKEAKARLGQKDKQFSASIVPILAGGTVDITNDDTVRHHIRCSTKPWDFNLKPRAPGETVARKFEADNGDNGLGVAPVYCDVHSNMRAHVLVMPNPYYQLLPETGGKFSLKGLPAGTYTITAWHPTLKPVPVKVTVKAGESKSIELVMLGKQD